ncbi:MAG TPA: ABC transporter substrate-binding protein [Aliicoccus persicus]|uniref:ABC transporter substrate-binding protein n=1 Tax=Aliicoccus persicus TaxID=930138 RepID=A0A921DY69_9STAP|nr:ABC transporter substrate-binding protein [Aliicoccus persicus]
MKRVSLLGLLTVISLFLFGHNGSINVVEASEDNDSSTDEPIDGGTIVVGIGADPMGYNPNAVGDDFGYYIYQNIFNRLMKLNNNQEIIPDLAKDYELSEDGLTLTFYLEEDVKWHDGEEFSSEDVKFTFDTIMEENGQASSSLSSVNEITTPDENTVSFNLNRKDSALLGNLSWYGIFIMPKHIYEGTDWITNPANRDPIGTGPFKFVEHNSGVNITLEKNEDYWGDVPYLDRVIYSVMPDSNTAIQALNNGELDILGVGPPFSEMEGFKSNPQFKVGELIWPSRFQIAFNMEDDDFSDQRVRDAVAYGVDKDAIVEIALNNNGIVANTGMVPAYEAVLNEEDVFPNRDVEKAKELLEEAGYTADSNGMYFSTTIDVFSGEPYENIATVFRENLREVGIEVSINVMESAAWSDKVWDNKNYSISLLAGYQGPGPGGLNGRFSSDGSMNIYNYSNPELDDLLVEAAQQADMEASAPYYQEAQKLLVEDKPMLPLSEWVMVDPYQSYIEGHPTSEEAIGKTGFYEYTYIWIND